MGRTGRAVAEWRSPPPCPRAGEGGRASEVTGGRGMALFATPDFGAGAVAGCVELLACLAVLLAVVVVVVLVSRAWHQSGGGSDDAMHAPTPAGLSAEDLQSLPQNPSREQRDAVRGSARPGRTTEAIMQAERLLGASLRPPPYARPASCGGSPEHAPALVMPETPTLLGCGNCRPPAYGPRATEVHDDRSNGRALLPLRNGWPVRSNHPASDSATFRWQAASIAAPQVPADTVVDADRRTQRSATRDSRGTVYRAGPFTSARFSPRVPDTLSPRAGIRG